MTDIVGQAKAALDKLHEVCAASDEVLQLRVALAIEDLAEVVPELVAEIESLRAEIRCAADEGDWV